MAAFEASPRIFHPLEEFSSVAASTSQLSYNSPPAARAVDCMIDLQTISIMIAATEVMIAAIYYVLILRNQNQTRQAQLFMQLAQQLYEQNFYPTAGSY